jgi:hypothetical protein
LKRKTKTIVLGIRLTEDENALLIRDAQRAGVSLPDYVRRRLFAPARRDAAVVEQRLDALLLGQVEILKQAALAAGSQLFQLDDKRKAGLQEYRDEQVQRLVIALQSHLPEDI